jgi:DNA-binding NarL/FixJ family response regulator
LGAARVRWALTPRQCEVLERLAIGDSNKEIATSFGMSVRTVEQHVAEILKRAEVDSRLRLVARFWCP